MGNDLRFPTGLTGFPTDSHASEYSAVLGIAPRKILLVYGTRPEAIKMAPLILALDEAEGFEAVSVVTGQHREMLDQVLAHFSITPAHDLKIMEPGQSLTDITVRTLERFTPIISAEAPDAVVVQGDTTAAMAGALAAFYQQIPVVHLEAGLRSGDLLSPFPEELNRRLVSQLAALHLAPTGSARDNLLYERTDPQRIVVTGNTVIDSLLWSIEHPAPYSQAELRGLDVDPRRVILVTAHRRESWGEPMKAIGAAIAAIAGCQPDVVFVLPVHRNPVVRESLLPAIEGLDNVIICEPLGYGEFVRLIDRADLILTDSGGLQEEGPALGKPVLVMRETTERPEAVEAGGVRLVGTDVEVIVDAVLTLLQDGEQYDLMAVRRDVYGDGQAARRSVAALRHLFGIGSQADEFTPRVRELMPL